MKLAPPPLAAEPSRMSCRGLSMEALHVWKLVRHDVAEVPLQRPSDDVAAAHAQHPCCLIKLCDDVGREAE